MTDVNYSDIVTLNFKMIKLFTTDTIIIPYDLLLLNAMLHFIRRNGENINDYRYTQKNKAFIINKIKKPFPLPPGKNRILIAYGNWKQQFPDRSKGFFHGPTVGMRQLLSQHFLTVTFD